MDGENTRNSKIRTYENTKKKRDFCYVVNGTASVSVYKHMPLIEFDLEGQEVYRDGGYFLKFHCVRGDATEEDLNKRKFPWRD